MAVRAGPSQDATHRGASFATVVVSGGRVVAGIDRDDLTIRLTEPVSTSYRFA